MTRGQTGVALFHDMRESKRLGPGLAIGWTRGAPWQKAVEPQTIPPYGMQFHHELCRAPAAGCLSVAAGALVLAAVGTQLEREETNRA